MQKSPPAADIARPCARSCSPCCASPGTRFSSFCGIAPKPLKATAGFFLAAAMRTPAAAGRRRCTGASCSGANAALWHTSARASSSTPLACAIARLREGGRRTRQGSQRRDPDSPDMPCRQTGEPPSTTSGAEFEGLELITNSTGSVEHAAAAGALQTTPGARWRGRPRS